MKKNTPLSNDEIDIVNLFKIIWDGKIKILLIIIISFGTWIHFSNTKNYLNSLTLNPVILVFNKTL